MRIVSVSQMQAIEIQAIRAGVSEDRLQEQAGQSLARHALALADHPGGGRFVVMAGGGKNGGDGLIAARVLASAGHRIKAVVFQGKGLSPQVQAQIAHLRDLPSVDLTLATDQLPPDAATELRFADVILDALTGIGLTGELRPPLPPTIEAINHAGRPVLAADVPTGLDADTGRSGSAAVQASWTVTFGAPKTGLLRPEAAAQVGQLWVDPLEFPADLLADEASGAGPWFAIPAEIGPRLPRRDPLANKTKAGKVLVIGGSHAYHGAPLLAALGAARAGAGWTGLAYPQEMDTVVRAHTLESLCWPVPGRNGQLSGAALPRLLTLAREHQAVVLGPGLGRSSRTAEWVNRFLSEVRGPRAVVIDADALAAVLPAVTRPRADGPVFILTPHEGEAAALLKTLPRAVANHHAECARILAKKFQAIIALKGRFTAVAVPDGGVQLAGAGSQALAAAGTGDVLAGVIGAFAAQGLEPRMAALAGVMIHGVAGDLAREDRNGLGVMARDVAERLPGAIRRVRGLGPLEPLI